MVEVSVLDLPDRELSEPVFTNPSFCGHEQVVYCHDASCGLKAIIAVHSTALGPALGGVRFRHYDSEPEALSDVLRLAEGMTYKAALAGLRYGGGKSVIVGPPSLRSEELFRSFGRFVARLGGLYLAAEDVGTTEQDMDWIRQETVHVCGRSARQGGLGDPSPSTAFGVLRAMQAAGVRRWGTDDLAGRHVTIAGVGKVGSALAGLLAEAGARLTISDVDEDRAAPVAARYSAAVVDPRWAHAVECDIFAPCALGGILNRASIPQLRSSVVAGAANNQLADDGCARALDEAGILYVPDFVANAGGLIHVAAELDGTIFVDAIEKRVRNIYDTVLAVLDAAGAAGITPAAAAVELARARTAAPAAPTPAPPT
ncbi:MAG: Glu/Leu/Phe/Val dehydrogenase dimerization domain-containing protein [Actinomycetota bacterium]